MIDAHDLLPSPDQSAALLALVTLYSPNRPAVLADIHDLSLWGPSHWRLLNESISTLQCLDSMGIASGRALAEVGAPLAALRSLRDRAKLAAQARTKQEITPCK